MCSVSINWCFCATKIKLRDGGKLLIYANTVVLCLAILCLAIGLW